MNKKESELTNLQLHFDNKVIKSVLFDIIIKSEYHQFRTTITFDGEVDFNLHIGYICRSAENQLNVPMRLKKHFKIL